MTFSREGHAGVLKHLGQSRSGEHEGTQHRRALPLGMSPGGELLGAWGWRGAQVIK
jgi:hypothetical protein